MRRRKAIVFSLQTLLVYAYTHVLLRALQVFNSSRITIVSTYTISSLWHWPKSKVPPDWLVADQMIRDPEKIYGACEEEASGTVRVVNQSVCFSSMPLTRLFIIDVTILTFAGLSGLLSLICFSATIHWAINAKPKCEGCVAGTESRCLSSTSQLL